MVRHGIFHPSKLGPKKLPRKLLKLVADGLRNIDIAKELGCTEYAMKRRLQRVYDEMGFSNRVELAMWYVKYMEQR